MAQPTRTVALKALPGPATGNQICPHKFVPATYFYRRKKQGKKHKTWDGDAYISHIGNELKMISEDGKP